MPAYSIDVVYAYLKLGVNPGASRAEIEKALSRTRAHKFSTQKDINEVQRFADFFAARAIFASIDISFADIRKIYHQKAMELHPDRHYENKANETELKAINAAYHLVEAVYREAREHFKHSEGFQHKSEYVAGAARPSGERPLKYFAASVPRNIRNLRLGYLPPRHIIGSWHIPSKNNISQVFDIIMLPEKEFLRARTYLGAPGIVNPALQQGSFMPAYVLKDIKEVTIPANSDNPEDLARNHFRAEFKYMTPRARN